MQLAQTLLGVLPPELTALAEPEERATEYLHYRQFFMIWETLERVVECQSRDVPGMGREARATWSAGYSVSICFVPCSSFDWLMDLDATGHHR